jgi:hypothetical protein
MSPDAATIRFRVVGPLLETVSGDSELLEALPPRSRFTRSELIHETERLGWQLDGELQSNAQDVLIFVFERLT